MSEKPVIFISHSSLDKDMARVLQEQIETVLGGKENAVVFNSSDPYAIPTGSDWFEEIAAQLDKSHVLVVLVTASAKQSIWVGFEIGYFWSRAKGKHIYPVAVPGAKTFGPIEKLQAKSLDKPEHIDGFLRHLCQDLGIGDPTLADTKPIIRKASQNAKQTVPESEIRERIQDFLLRQYEPQTRLRIKYADVEKKLNIPRDSLKKYISQVIGD
jgi:MFS superfamily sulfate permease-like transporter